jgi:hypothetical protein
MGESVSWCDRVGVRVCVSVCQTGRGMYVYECAYTCVCVYLSTWIYMCGREFKEEEVRVRTVDITET